jgi:hypothetical protein
MFARGIHRFGGLTASCSHDIDSNTLGSLNVGSSSHREVCMCYVLCFGSGDYESNKRNLVLALMME